MLTPVKNTINIYNKPIEYGYAQIVIFGLNYHFKRTRLRHNLLIMNLQYTFNIGLLLMPEIKVLSFKRRLVFFWSVLFIKKIHVRNTKVACPQYIYRERFTFTQTHL